MSFYLRAINRENWPEPEDNASVHDLVADALNDLKTQDNTLSVWCAETDEELDSAMVAYLASMDRWVELETVEFVAIKSEDISAAGIECDEVPNFTYISEYKEKHRDFVALKYDSIEQIANIVIRAINAGQDYMIDQGRIKELFTEVVREGKLCAGDIDKSRHRKLQRLIVQIEEEIGLT